MFYCGDYDDLLEDSLIEELEWLKEEFEFLFNSRKHHPTEKDKQLANQMIENVFNKIDFLDDSRISDLLIEALENIEYNFPKFF
ncbi:MAG: hypothetical protein ACXACC_10285 [Promethearchaeota archaeon]